MISSSSFWSKQFCQVTEWNNKRSIWTYFYSAIYIHSLSISKVSRSKRFNMTVFHTSVIARYFFRCAFTNKLTWPVKRTGYSVWKKFSQSSPKSILFNILHPSQYTSKVWPVQGLCCFFFFQASSLMHKRPSWSTIWIVSLGCWDPSGACA